MGADESSIAGGDTERGSGGGPSNGAGTVKRSACVSSGCWDAAVAWRGKGWGGGCGDCGGCDGCDGCGCCDGCSQSNGVLLKSTPVSTAAWSNNLLI